MTGPPVMPERDSTASTALILGSISLVVNPLAVSSAIAIALGVRVLRRSNPRETYGRDDIDRKHATIAIVLGSIGALVWAVSIVLFVLFLIDVDSRLS